MVEPMVEMPRRKLEVFMDIVETLHETVEIITEHRNNLNAITDKVEERLEALSKYFDDKIASKDAEPV